MTLQDYMTAEGLTDAAMAAKLGVSQASVSRYRAFNRVPEPQIMKRIEEVTQRRVTASDFIDGAIARAAERRTTAA